VIVDWRSVTPTLMRLALPAKQAEG